MNDDVRLAPWFERLGRGGWLFIGIAGAVAIAVFAVTYLSDLVVPLVSATFLGTVFAPGVDWLERRRVPRALGAGLVAVGVVAVFAGSLAIVIVGIVQNADELSDWFDQAQTQLADLSESWELDKYLEQIRASGGESGFGSGLGSQLGAAAGSAVSFFSGLALGLVLFYYLLKDGRSLAESFIERHRPARAEQLGRITSNAVSSVRNYVKGRTILALVQGVAVGIAMWIMGVPLPFAIGIVTVITSYIPYLGAFVGGAFAVVMALAGGGTGVAVSALLVVLFVNLVLENALEPYVNGSTLNLHPVAVLLATVGGGLLGGVVGFVLASPLTAIGRNLYQELRDSGFFGDTDPDG